MVWGTFPQKPYAALRSLNPIVHGFPLNQMSAPKMPTLLDGWSDEMRSAYLYRVMATIEQGSPHSVLFSELANEAESWE